MNADPVVHILCRGGMTTACGLPRCRIFAAHIDAAKITCPDCRLAPEFLKLRPVVTERIPDPPTGHPKRTRQAPIRYNPNSISQRKKG